MYRCKVCDAQSARGKPLLRHVVTRKVPCLRRVRVPTDAELSNGHQADERFMREEIARELPVCEECARELRRGVSLDALANLKRAEKLPPAPQTPAPAPVATTVPKAKAVTW